MPVLHDNPYDLVVDATGHAQPVRLDGDRDSRFALRGRVLRGVTVVEIVTVTEPGEHGFDIIVAVARDMEARHERPCIKLHRDAAGDVDGITLAREVA